MIDGVTGNICIFHLKGRTSIGSLNIGVGGNGYSKFSSRFCNNVCCRTAGGDVHVAPGINCGAVSRPAGGDEHVAPGINCGVVCRTAGVYVHAAIGINCGVACCPAGGDVHVAP